MIPGDLVWFLSSYLIAFGKPVSHREVEFDMHSDILLLGLDLPTILVFFAADFILHGYSDEYLLEDYL